MNLQDFTKKKSRPINDKKLLKKDFKLGQHVLLFNSRLKLFPGKLKSKWSGPFVIKKVWSYGAIELYDPQSHNPDKTWVVNGQRLKPYHGEEFTRAHSTVHLITHWGKSVKLMTLKKCFLGGNPVLTFFSFCLSCIAYSWNLLADHWKRGYISLFNDRYRGFSWKRTDF